MMKIAVVYQSRGGNTKAVAKIIAEEFHVQEISVDKLNHQPGEVDVLFLGGGVYEWRMDKSLKTWIEQLDAKKIGQIVCFSTTGYMNSTLKQIREAATKKGIAVNENELLIKMFLKGHSLLGLQGGNLSDQQKDEVHQFVDKVKREIKYEQIE